MATTQDKIRCWLERGKQGNATHMLVACDTFDYEDYPVYVQPGQDVAARVAGLNGKNMQRVMEVYNFALPLEAQLNENRAWHL
jgi:hypothetical protein